MKITQITETATVAGSIASVSTPLGATQTRSEKPPKAPKVKKAKKYVNVISEGKMKELTYDILHLDNGNFLKKYRKPKDYFISKLGQPMPVQKEEVLEADLIVVPGMRRMKDKSFIPHSKDRRDHEVEMARSELYAAAKDAMRIFKLLKDRSEDEGIMGWQQSYITLASDYLNSVADSLEYQMNMYEMTAGVIAGGMSNFEEDAMNEISNFKKKELEYELRNEPANNYQVNIDGRKWKVFADKTHAEAVARKLRAKGKDVKIYITGERPNIDEGKRGIPSKAEMLFDKMLELRTKAKMANDRQRFKELEAIKNQLENLEKQVLMLPKGQMYLDKFYNMLGTDVQEQKCPECGNEMVNEELMNEKKDACYYKVKSRYKVWPSAYASGALVKCRKKGASNWGNKSKK